MTITNAIKFHAAHNIARILKRRGMDYRLAFAWAMREMWRAVEAFNVDGIEYYNQAMQIVNPDGIEVEFAIKTSRQGEQHNGATVTGRFRDMDEAKRELNSRIEQAIKPLEGRVW